jgi:undecaprenyl-diphosphatase
LLYDKIGEMSILNAILFGLIQGFAEMLPISSSAHLVLFPWIFGFTDPGLAFDVALHLGTLVAILAYFWRDWVDMASSLLKLARERKVTSQSQKLAGLLLIASVPGAIFGFALGDLAERTFRNPLLIAVTLVVAGVLLYIADHRDMGSRKLADLNVKDAILVGLAQAVAIIPGVSRSGATITMGLFSGITREDAARFSFLMSAPIIAGAALVKVLKLDMAIAGSLPFWLSILAAVISSVLAIKLLLALVRKQHFDIFVYYRFALAAIILFVYFNRL